MSDDKIFKRSYNQVLIDEYEKHGPVCLGPYSSFTWRHDAKHLLFTLARYKFCAKMLAGKRRILEIGCGDAIGGALVLQGVDVVHGIDLEDVIINHDKRSNPYPGRMTFDVLDITEASPGGIYDAAISLDVLEHIDADRESRFMQNVCSSLRREAIFIVGTPNIAAQVHASLINDEGHTNLKTADALRALLATYFENVLIFSMNDEVVHTGYYPMAHYLLGMGIGVKMGPS
ncbi:MAG: methyltransferase domain-containing protein [Phycisphaerae bacterium]|nr:methyltransferase domain-containing protein [Phycisphaerae bacterium]